MRPQDLTNEIQKHTSPALDIPCDPTAEHWHRAEWLKARAKFSRGYPLTPQEKAFVAVMDSLAGMPEFRADAEKHTTEFALKMRARRVAALKLDAERLEKGLGDWGVPIPQARAIFAATGEDAARKRIVFEEKHGRAACDELQREIRQLDKIKAEIAATEAAPLGTLSSADAERRAARVKAIQAERKGVKVTA